jgi:hypothetical protein
MKTSTPLERHLTLLCLGFIGCILGLIICFAAEHTKRVQYEQAACALSDVCHAALDCEDLDAIAFEEIYEDVTGNLDCYGMCIDRKFITDLSWAY